MTTYSFYSVVLYLIELGLFISFFIIVTILMSRLASLLNGSKSDGDSK